MWRWMNETSGLQLNSHLVKFPSYSRTKKIKNKTTFCYGSIKISCFILGVWYVQITEALFQHVVLVYLLGWYRQPASLSVSPLTNHVFTVSCRANSLNDWCPPKWKFLWSNGIQQLMVEILEGGLPHITKNPLIRHIFTRQFSLSNLRKKTTYLKIKDKDSKRI